jgi:hypothetical protein
MEAVIANRPNKKSRLIGFSAFVLPAIGLFAYSEYVGLGYIYILMSFVWLILGRVWESKLGPQEQFEYISINNGVIKHTPAGWLNSLSISAEQVIKVIFAKGGLDFGGSVEVSIYLKNSKCRRFNIPSKMAGQIMSFFESNNIAVENYA